MCFLPGTLALGVVHGQPDAHMVTAKALGAICQKMYAVSKSGLGPEIVHFNTVPLVSNQDVYIKTPDSHSLLRPEAVEAWFYLFRTTKDAQYQQWGWEMFEAIEKHARIDTGGYSNVKDVSEVPVKHTDMMESFFLAETLKYLYLLFDEQQAMFALDKWVFNTEAHPLPVYES